MKQNYGEQKPTSFAETVRCVERYVTAEIIKEAETKQLYYHTIDHALAVKRRAGTIFQAIAPALASDYATEELERIQCLLDLCGLAHDMVQLFDLTKPTRTRQPSGVSERETARKLLDYIRQLNSQLDGQMSDRSILFDDKDLQIIEDGIIATICQLAERSDPGVKSTVPSIYQPYLYNPQPKISLVGQIIALADLGTLGMDGIDNFIRDSILIFLEENLDLKELVLDCDLQQYKSKNSLQPADCAKIKARILAMTRFMTNLAHDRQRLFESEIAQFPPSARQILRERVFVYFQPQHNLAIEDKIPTDDANLQELADFFCLNRLA